MTVAVIFLIAILIVLSGDTSDFFYQVPLYFSLLLSLPLVVLGSGRTASVFTVRDWRRSGAGVIARVHQISMIVGLVAFAWFVWQWNLLGWQY